jgi:hypothetical protein
MGTCMIRNRAMSHGPVCDRYMTHSVSVEMREMQFPEPRASEQKRKEAEAEADCETD